MLGRLLSGHSPARRFVKGSLLTLAVTLVIVALARPCWGIEYTKSKGTTEDIVFAVDTSRSMTARDVAPSRLERAKRAIATFAGLHSTGRIGLVAFAGEAFVQCPPTDDRDIFLETIDALDTNVIPTPGTDIGTALDSAFAAFGQQKGRRTVILVTDGEDLAQDGVETAKKLAREGVVVHAVGIGGTAGYTIAASARDNTGAPVVTRLDESTLKEIAAATGGRYFRIDGDDAGLRSVEAGLLQTADARDINRTPSERFVFPLALALALLAAEGLVGTRRKPVSGATLRRVAPLAILALLLPGVASAGEAEKLYDSGTRALIKGDLNEAATSLREAIPLADESLRPKLLTNLGHARARTAAKAFETRVPGGEPAKIMEKEIRATDSPLAQVEKALADHKAGAFDEQAASGAYAAGQAGLKALRKQLAASVKTLAAGEATIPSIERARDDFRSAAELAPTTPGAAANAKAITDYTSGALKTLDNERSKNAEAGNRAKVLNEKLKELKKLLKQNQDQSRNGDDDQEEDDDDPEEREKDRDKKDKKAATDKRSEQERREQEGREQRVSKEDALAALESMQGETRRRLNIGDREGKPAPDPKGKDW